MSYVYSAAIYSPGEGKSVKNMESNSWRGEIETSRGQIDFDDIELSTEGMRRFTPNNTGGSNLTPPHREDDVIHDETLFFERNRIKQLQDERVHIQKKTFTKWCNSFLSRARLEINDLFVDVGDGIMLMKLLEIISGEKLGKPNRGRMRVQKIENLNKVLDFLKKKKIQLENIGAEDILDRNERLILGLIWTIILRFQIDIIVVDEEERGERKHAKDALLLWCQRKTLGYRNVRVENFTTSWRSGLAFNALIHSHRPDLVNFDALNPNDHIGNLNNAFDTAEKHLEIARLLDAEDVDSARPEEKSIITYVSLYYHHFAKQKSEMTGARRVANIVGKLMTSESLENEYENVASDLLQWINATIRQLDNRRFPNNLSGMRDELTIFNQFRTVEKPPKYKEKGELEALFFTIQTKRKAMGRKPYVPLAGLNMFDIETAWEKLDRAENNRQAAIIAELQRQERLEQQAQCFHKKADLREGWVRNAQAILDEMDHGRTVTEVEKAVKKQQAIATDIMAREDRFKMLSNLCNELTKEHYHESDKVRAREREISERWAQLLSQLNNRRQALNSLNTLMTLLRDIDTLSGELKLIEPSLRNRDIGKHLFGVEDLLVKHELIEAQVNTQGNWLAGVTKEANLYIRNKGQQHDVLQRKLEDVTTQYKNLVELAAYRRAQLERAKDLFQFVQDHTEEMAWLHEKETLCEAALHNYDVSAAHATMLMYKNTETESQAHWARSKQMIAVGERLMQSGASKEDIQSRISQLQRAWENFRSYMQKLGQYLNEAHQAQQFLQDANEAESWIREKMPLVKSDDLGRDEGAAESLLQRHCRLEEEINSYRADIVRLEDIAAQLANSSFNAPSTSTQETYDTTVPQLKVMYPYTGKRIAVAKGEIVAQMDDSTPEWLLVLKQDGTEGYVPRDYVQQVPGEVTVTVHAVKQPNGEAGDNRKIIADRQAAISNDYRKLNRLADVRRRLLSDNIKLMRFYRECNEFEIWAREIEQALTDEPTVEHVKAFRVKFDKIESDIKANGGLQLKRINEMADELINEGHGQSKPIENRRRKINLIWSDLDRLRKERGARLEATERVAEFDSSCDDARSWMQSKFDVLDRKPQDLKSLQNLEIDLKPLEDKIQALEKLAAEVRKDHPEAAAAIDKQIADLKKLHQTLLSRANDKIKMAEQTQGQEMFETALRSVNGWIQRTKKVLGEDLRPVNVQEAEELLKKHYDLGEEIKDKGYEIDYVHELGKRLLDKNPRLQEVKTNLADLSADMNKIKELHRIRDARLKDQLDLQLFNREAERIDATTKGHEAFLDYAELGDSVESVENLIKRHKNLEAKLDAQVPRLQTFSQTADDLISRRHPDSPYVDQRRVDVLSHREAIRKLADKRRHQLEASLQYQNLCRDIHEMNLWMNEKKKTACDDAHRDLSSISNKLLKHEAFEAEIAANQPRIEAINKEGAALIALYHPDTHKLDSCLKDMNSQWAELQSLVYKKGEKLRQAAEQKNLNSVLDDSHAKLDELHIALRSGELGSDLRSVKDLLQKHAVLEQDMMQQQRKLQDISSAGQRMADQGHFDSEKIGSTIHGLLRRFDELSGPAAARKAALEESRKWHQLAFDVDCEKQWIAEKKPIAASQDIGSTLSEALNLQKKQEQLESEIQQHAPRVFEALSRGNDLMKFGHPCAKDIKRKCTELSEAWDELNALIAARRKILESSLMEQQYINGVGEVENWMQEKRRLLISEDYGADEDAALKLLARHKAMQQDIQSYRTFVEDTGRKAQGLIAAKTPNCNQLAVFQKDIENEYQRIKDLAESRRRALEDAVSLYEYMRESADLEQWIDEQLHTAMSEDYGEDYEHLQELQSKFNEFKQSVKTGSERFVSCEASANAILRRNPPFGRDILKKQEKLRSVWTLLLDYIESREQKLGGAEELHRFSRDVADHEEWVNEKINTMSRDIGKDSGQAHRLWQQHEALEHEIKGMEPNLHRLLDESARLIQAYPGGNAEHIATQQTALADGWRELKEVAAQRRDILQVALDYHRFQKEARDLLAWADTKLQHMESDTNIMGLTHAEYAQKEHSALSSEIDTREPEFLRLIKVGTEMAKLNFQKDEIEYRTDLVRTALSRLRTEWNIRNSYLSQVAQWHAFQSEAKSILDAISAKRTTLANLQMGGTVPEVEKQMERLDTFSKALCTLDDRSHLLDQTARELVESRHMEREKIDLLRQKVQESLAILRGDIERRRSDLSDAYALASFSSDVADMMAWIDEKLKGTQYENQAHIGEDKLKRLQRHQALEAELATNRNRIETILRQGRELSSRHHHPEIQQKSNQLLNKWDELVAACSEQSHALEQYRDCLTFQQLVDRMLQWIREKELMVSSNDMGSDLEHCKVLIERLSAGSEQYVDEQTLAEINALADKLIKQGRTGKDEVQQKQQYVNQAWHSLHKKLAKYRHDLNAALEVHAYNRDVADTNERVLEKLAFVQNADFGHDLATVDVLLRKLAITTNDIAAIEAKLAQHDRNASIIFEKEPPLAETMAASLQKLQESCALLRNAGRQREIKLKNAYALFKYLDSVKKTENWAAAIRAKMTNYSTPQTSEAAKNLLNEHQERKAEIDARQPEIAALHNEGQMLATTQPEHKTEVQRANKRVQNSEHQLRQAWESEKAILTRSLEYLLWCDRAAMIEQWLANKEGELKQAEVGNNADAVDILIKAHAAFEETVIVQSERLAELKNEAEAFTDSTYMQDRTERCNAIVDRHQRLLQACAERRVMLIDSKRFHEFIRSCGELIMWITAKLQVAYDESYLDPTNLLAKLRNQRAFDKELNENEQRLKAVEVQGEQLIHERHFMSVEVKEQLAELRSGWDELRTKSALKSERLQEAYEANKLRRRVDDMEEWLDSVERQLASDNHGSDMESVEHLVKKLNALNTEIQGQADIVDDLLAAARQLKVKGSSTTEPLLDQAENLHARYVNLKRPVEIRRQNLEDAKRFYEWLYEAQDEYEWINNKIPHIRSATVGDSLESAQRLQKRHTTLEKELETRETTVREVQEHGLDLIRRRHFASNDISTHIDILTSSLTALKEAMRERRTRLQQSVDCHKFYNEVEEAIQWIQDHTPMDISQDLGKDLCYASSQLRQTEQLKKQAVAYCDEHLYELERAASKFPETLPEYTNISHRLAEMQSVYQNLLKICDSRITLLGDASRFHHFVRQVDEFSEWLREKQKAANSEDYGRDLEDCMQLREQFETVLKQLASSGETYAAIQRRHDDLNRCSRNYSASTHAKYTDLELLWKDVNVAASERQQALNGAMQVHKFDQEADQTLTWLSDKEATGAAMESEDLSLADIAGVKAQMQRHDEFVHELKAVEKQVAQLVKEAEHLWTAFPDTRQHLAVRTLEMENQLADVLQGAQRHHARLQHMEQMQSYFQEYNELMHWLRRIQTTMTSQSLPRDLPGCEALARRHEELNVEMQSRRSHIDEFTRSGREMTQKGHVLAKEIDEKVNDLQRMWNLTVNIWKDRNDLYTANFDCKQWLHVAGNVEQWLSARESALGEDWKTVDSVDMAENLVSDYADFMVTVNAQGERCEQVKRLTLIEQNFQDLRLRESERVRAEQTQQRRRDTIKVVEKGDILASRRQERERRKTQEISLMRPGGSVSENIGNSQTLPRNRDSRDSMNDRVRRITVTETNPTNASASVATVSSASPVTASVVGPESEMTTPSFNTRRTTPHRFSMPKFEENAIDMKGFFDRKHVFQSSGKKAAVRTWKNYYGILCGQLLCFFKDEGAFASSQTTHPPVNIFGARCEPFPEYLKRKNTFRLSLRDGSEYLFACADERQMLEWVAKIKFHAELPPSNQLKSYSYNVDSGLGSSQFAGDVSGLPQGYEGIRDYADSVSSRDKTGSFTSTVTVSSVATTSAGDTNGYVETLHHREHETSPYAREVKAEDGSSFISWVETNQPNSAAHSSHDDTDSIKSGRRRNFSIFKRGSKTGK